MVKTDIQIALPSGCYGRVGEYTAVKRLQSHSRTGLAASLYLCLKLSELVSTKKGCHEAM